MHANVIGNVEIRDGSVGQGDGIIDDVWTRQCENTPMVIPVAVDVKKRSADRVRQQREERFLAPLADVDDALEHKPYRLLKNREVGWEGLTRWC
jgi:hypothetical protein